MICLLIPLVFSNTNGQSPTERHVARVQEFAAIDRALGQNPSPTNLDRLRYKICDLLIADVEDLGSDAKSGDFEKSLKLPPVYWDDVETDRLPGFVVARNGPILAVGVPCRTAGRVAAIDLRTRRGLELPSSIRYLDSAFPRPQFTSNGDLIVWSEQSMNGTLIPVNVDFLTPHRRSYRDVGSIPRLCDMVDDHYGAYVKGNTVVLLSVDPPRSCFGPVPLMKKMSRVESFEIRFGRVVRTHVYLGNVPLRRVDAWLARARRARRPDAAQRQARTIDFSNTMLDEYKSARLPSGDTLVELTFDDRRLTFRVSRAARVTLLAVTKNSGR